MADQVNVPKVGPVDKKWVLVAVAGGATFVGIMWWRRFQASKSAGAAVVDPATGSVGASGSYLNPAPVVANDTVNQPPAAAATNQEWTQRVIADLGNIGLDASFVSAVIGKYLAGQQVTNDEASVIRQAWAFEGKPPGGPSFINLGTGSSTPGTTTPPPVTIPPGEIPPIPVPSPKPAPAPAPKPRTQPVGHWPAWDGSLTGIANHYHVSEPALYQRNKDTIEAAAHAHGHSSSNNGNLIFPGTLLIIP
jgi:hypothetical protein